MAMTNDQLKAINSEGNVLVSAGAGSGKTTVLTERVIRKINEGVKIDELLILTFTNAAAKEMRNRIKEELLKNGKSNLINEVDSAHIQTFDAYALYIVKKYGYLINLPQSINNVPEDVIDIKVRHIVNDLFDEYYQKNDEIFNELINTYCIKDDSDLIKFVISFYKITKSKLDKDAYLNTYIDTYLNDEVLSKNPEVLFKYSMDAFSVLEELFNKISLEKLHDQYEEGYRLTLNTNNLKDFAYEGQRIKNPTCRVPKDDFEDREIKAEITNLMTKPQNNSFKDNLFTYDEELYKNVDCVNSKKFMPLIIDMVKKIDKKVFEFEVEKGYFTFSDISLLAFKIIKENTKIREDIKSKTKLIFIDEYQDTSDLQDQFIELISNNNVFAVGDVKQSIYLFRGANPTNFMNKYEEYKKLNQAIDMTDNFRSRKEIVKKINEIFNKIMTKDYGGADYSVSHNLKPSNLDYETKGKIEGQHGIVKLYYDDLFNDVILDIKKRVSSKMLVYDRHLKIVRPVKYGDFAILSPAKTKFLDFEKAMRNANLPINAVYDEELLSEDSVFVLLSLLKAIRIFNLDKQDKIEFCDLKHAFVSIVRSFLYKYSDQKIYEEMTNNTYREDPIYLKIKDFSYKHKYSSLSDLFSDLLNEFDFVHKLNSYEDPLSHIDKIKIFSDRIQIMDSLNFTLDDFIGYLGDLKDYGISMNTRHDPQSDDSILMTTIHKSKGLQYKIVYLIGLDSPGKREGHKLLVDDEIGAWLPSFAFHNAASIQSQIVSYRAQAKKREEKMRLLYVALTRTEDSCILLYKKDSNDFVPDLKKVETLHGFLSNSGVDFEEDSYAEMKIEDDTKRKNIEKSNEQLLFSKINLSFDKNFIKEKASKDLNFDADMNTLNFGTHMHLLMEEVDFKTKDTSFIKNNFEKSRIDRVLNNAIFKNCIDANIYKEYQFIDEANNRNGIIDLLLVYKEKAVVVDYKLKHINDEAYVQQLNIYRNFVESYFKLPCECYLLSLIDDETKEIKKWMK